MLKIVATSALFASTLIGCHAQTPALMPDKKPAEIPAGVPTATGTPLTIEASRRVEVLVRQKANIPPGSTLTISNREASEFSGFDRISITILNDGHTSRPIQFLISKDTGTLAQLTKFDIAADPRDLISPTGRPSRGGPATAPVLIVGFDDLECPYCARLHATIFPAITQRYGDKVHIVYKDYPLESIHPWAMHAAIDVNCLADQSPEGYWTLVDQVHAHASDISSAAQKDPDTTKALAAVYTTLDTMTFQEGRNRKVDEPKLAACVKAQDTKPIKASMAVGDSFNLESAPILFINGDKIDGAVPLDYLFTIIDTALRAEGQTPPPPYLPLTPPPTAKPGN